MFVIREIWRALFPWNTRFEIRTFALLPTIYQKLFAHSYQNEMKEKKKVKEKLFKTLLI